MFPSAGEINTPHFRLGVGMYEEGVNTPSPHHSVAEPLPLPCLLNSLTHQQEEAEEEPARSLKLKNNGVSFGGIQDTSFCPSLSLCFCLTESGCAFLKLYLRVGKK
jgi:hypothetical protein